MKWTIIQHTHFPKWHVKMWIQRNNQMNFNFDIEIWWSPHWNNDSPQGSNEYEPSRQSAQICSNEPINVAVDMEIIRSPLRNNGTPQESNEYVPSRQSAQSCSKKAIKLVVGGEVRWSPHRNNPNNDSPTQKQLNMIPSRQQSARNCSKKGN